MLRVCPRRTDRLADQGDLVGRVVRPEDDVGMCEPLLDDVSAERSRGNRNAAPHSSPRPDQT